MATVYRAQDAQGDDFAVKILHPGKAETDELRRFRREFLALRDLRHPNVVQVYEAGAQSAYPWIAMEYVDGADLGTVIDRWGANPPADRFAQVEQLFVGLCEGLAYIHDQGLIHRDLKPSNVLVTGSGQAKLTDFGVVKAPGAFTTQLTVAGKLVGTVAFMSPEQITGEEVTFQSDLYSLGAVLYMMLTLRRPIEADNIAGYLARHITETPRLPSEIVPDCPVHLEQMCMHLLEKEPRSRPSGASEVLAVLSGEAPPPQRVIHGREQALDWLQQRMDHTAQGGGGVAIVLGPDGAGRTALLEVFVERARAGGSVVAAVSGSRPNALQRLTDQLPGSGSLDARVQAAPCALVIDDLDRLSSAHINALSQMVRERIAIEGRPIIVIGTVQSMTGPAAGLCSGADTGLSPDRLDLTGVNRDAAIRIVRDQGVTGALAAALGRRLVVDLDGAPGAIVEQIGALVQAGWLIPTPDGGLRPGQSMDALRTGPLPLPDRIQHREAARIEALPPDARAIFEALVVLDMEATLELVSLVSDTNQVSLATALATLRSAGLVLLRSEGVHEVVELSRARFRDVAYRLIDKDRRAALHCAAADALRNRGRRRTGSFAEVIASHLLSGGQIGEAYPMLLVAAQNTLRTDNLPATTKLLDKAERARTSCERSMSPEESHKCRRRLFTLRGQVLLRGGSPSEAIDAWQEALRAARDEGDEESIARAQAGVGLSQMALGETAEATAGLAHGLQRLPQGDPMWAQAAEALARVRITQGDIEGAQKLWTELLELGREMGEGEVHARAMVGLGLVALVHGEMERGRDDLESAVFRMRDHTNRRLLPEALIRLGELSWAQGRLERAQAQAREADALAREAMQISDCVAALGLAAMCLLDMGQREEAAEIASNAAALARTQGPTRTLSQVAQVLATARVLTLLGQYEAAQSLLPSSPPSGTRSIAGLDDPAGGLLAVKSRIVAARNPVVATALARQVLSRPASALPWATARHRLDAAHTLRLAGETDGAKAAVQGALDCLGTHGFRRLEMEAALMAEGLGMAPTGMASGVELRAELDHELGSPQGFIARWTL
jgi:tetratricopeptide (TPR) repeat protein